ncbi:hypothetical protein BGW80DRAFT_1315212 [Lactifluus volemus]|nr:hypothetical protein BGW80DRAFT_1315212 [Lactifluus volemus]
MLQQPSTLSTKCTVTRCDIDPLYSCQILPSPPPFFDSGNDVRVRSSNPRVVAFLLILSSRSLVSPAPVLGLMPRSTCVVTGDHRTNYADPRCEYLGPICHPSPSRDIAT